MSKILSGRKHFRLSEAVIYLSAKLKESVTEDQILQLALDKSIVLSIHIPYGTSGYKCRVLNCYQTDKAAQNGEDSLWEGCSEESELLGVPVGNMLVTWDDQVHDLQGIYDLPMIADEVLCVERAYQKLTDRIRIAPVHTQLCFVQRGEELFLLLEKWHNEEEPFDILIQPTDELPESAAFIIKKEAIDNFLKATELAKPEKPFSTKQNESVLKLIATICLKTKYDINEWGAIADLARCADRHGIDLSEGTISTFLKRVKAISKI